MSKSIGRLYGGYASQDDFNKFIEENYDTSQSPRNGSQKGDLTSQWHKGELPNDEYYIVNKYNVIEKVRYCKEFKGFCDNEKDLVKEVLAEVPDYVEWRNMVNCACEEHEANKRLIEENAQLKELLKECQKYIETMYSGAKNCNLDSFSDIAYHIGIELLTKIDGVMK